MEIEVTWGRAVRVWWAYFWRNIVVVITGVIAGGILGFIVGLIMGAMGFAPKTIQFVVTPLGAIIGLGLSIIPMKMVLGKDFGQFRLVLVSKE